MPKRRPMKLATLLLVLRQGAVARLIFRDDFAAPLNASCADCADCTDCLRGCTTCPWRTSVTGTPAAHSTRTIAPCPPGRDGSCITFNVTYCPPEHPGAKTGACYRSELAGAKVQPGLSNLEYGHEWWFGFSLRLPDAYSLGKCRSTLVTHCNLDEIHFQIHGSPNKDLDEPSRNPVFALELVPDPTSETEMSWRAVARGDPKLNLSYNVNPKGPSYPPVPHYEWQNASVIGPAYGGQWDDFVYHTRYAYNATGFVELWRRGRKVIDWHGMGTAFNDQPAFGGKPPYLKIGVYKFGWKFPADFKVTDSQVTYSELRVGDGSSSYAEVDTAPDARV